MPAANYDIDSLCQAVDRIGQGGKIRNSRGNIMNQKPIPPRGVAVLAGAAVALPVAICVVLAVSALLGAMNDTTGGRVLIYVSWAFGVAWVIDLICLVVILAVNSLSDGDSNPE